ncbi:unnamed protein product [Caenorhabditis bovis]|uniref:Uncharacterized protein n=1 Tax=Caenorhabditis bovis TaxID=2654633 RepID=A0A8S1EVB5_9PELO|nr:unnamed protein product [Caenorhabditis bovis]
MSQFAPKQSCQKEDDLVWARGPSKGAKHHVSKRMSAKVSSKCDKNGPERWAGLKWTGSDQAQSAFMAGVYSIDVHQEFDTLCSSLKGSDLLELQILQIVQLYAHHLHTAESEQHQLMYAEECGEEVTALIEQKMPGYEVDEHELYFHRMRECLELEQLISECSEAEKEYRRKEWLLEILNDDVSDDDLSDSEEYDDPSEEVGIDVEEEKESFDSLPTFDIPFSNKVHLEVVN